METIEHKGYTGSVLYTSAGMFYGNVKIYGKSFPYEGATKEQLEEDFKAAVDEQVRKNLLR